MFVIIGYVVVLAAVFGGYALAGGKFAVIIKAAPIELFIIGGAALGAFLVGNNGKVIKATFKTIPTLFKGSKYTKARYMDLLALLYDVLQKARKEGLMSIERDVEAPHESPIFSKYPSVTSDHHVVEFLTDYLRMMVGGNLNAFEIENLMDIEIETHHHEAHTAPHVVSKVADAVPAFGIVVAVMGVVNVMGSVGQPPAVLGKMIGGALVGTFLGILLSYGFVAPIASQLEQRVEEGGKIYQCMKLVLLASMNGYAPQVAVEFGRKVLYSTDRPGFVELEQEIKNRKG